MDSRSLSEPTVDSRWFAAFIREHESVLQATALRLCGNPTDARDLVQDTLERGLKNLSRYKPGTDGRAWLLTILHHIFIDRCRSRTRERRADVSAEDVEEKVAAPEPDAQPAWAAISPEQLREALDKIPEEFRLVYQLHSLEGRSYIEIAERLGIPKATVGTRLIRARRRLKELLMPTVTGGAEA
ncbi:RNA polymerase sigma factor [Hyalangium minutum]|uniref:RNA polymerase sigma factor n=1 Tax=Hyalangium minutum TaxID=394096 RepID=UPI001F0A6B39|nr:RNA polymerase sigma factor [Hyalangium minutum]